MGKPLISNLIVYSVLVLTVSAAAAEEGNDCGYSAAVNSATDLKYKIVAIFSTLIVGVFGICLPIFGVDVDGIIYALVKHFGAYVMGLPSVIYILPDARASLTSSCIGDFPMTAVVIARAAAFLTMIESKSFASALMNRSHDRASPHLSTIKPLVPAITFHHLFEGIGRGGYISKAKFELKKTLIMVIVFSLSAPVGIGIGIGVAEIYYKNGPTTLIVSGFCNAAAVGMLLFRTGVANFDFKPHSTSHMLQALGYVLLVLM
ncbi:hypothetical protein Bca101_060051 [Brassica carinata]